MPSRDIVVIGGSTGAIEVLREVIRNLPTDLAATVFVVIHIAPNSAGVLPQILSRLGGLPAAAPADGEAIIPGRVYVAPPDHHLLIDGDRVRVTRGPRENRFRPAIDPLFRTASHTFGNRVIAVVLSGGGDDGTAGASIVKAAGGVVIVQHPEDALVPTMPASAMAHVTPDGVLLAADIAARIVQLVDRKKSKGALAMTKRDEHDVAESGAKAMRHQEVLGPPSAFTCPQCGGALWEINEKGMLRYRCHVGHGFTADSLIEAQDEALEGALWTALRALEENSGLRRRMAERARNRDMKVIAKSCEEQARDFEQRADDIRRVLLDERIATRRQG